MKTIWNYSWAAVAMLAALASCQKENDQAAGETLPSAPEKGRVTLTASIPAEGLTKVSFTEADNGSGKMRLTKLSWEADDVITVNGNEFTVKEGSISEDGLSATFQGEDPGNGPYNIAYTSAPDDLNNQTQPADGDAGKLGYSVSLTGADAYEEVSFTSAWAGSHGAAFAQSSVLQLRATLPAAVASAVQRVVFKSSAAIFNGRDSLTVKLTTPGTAGEDNKLDIYAMLPAGDVTLAEDMDLLVQFQVSDKAYDKYTAFRHFASGTPFIQSGATQYLGLNCSNITSYANASTTSIGTSANPYLIGDQHQMQAIAGELVAGETKYFKLVDNINMTSVSWTSLNASNPKTKAVNLDGNGKTISHLNNTLFYDLNGTLSNLTISDVTITNAGNYRGVLANAVETAPCIISGVTVTNSSISGGYRIGGLIGKMGSSAASSEITNCAVSASVSGLSTYVGGLIGQIETSSITITGCSSYGNASGSQYIGGLIGELNGGSVVNSYSSVDITSSGASYPNAGGLIGNINSGSVTGCHYADGTISVSGSNAGGLIGSIKTGTVQRSYASATVGATGNNVGGLVGSAEGNSNSGVITIQNCYTAGSITGNYNRAGIIGSTNAACATISISNSYTTCSIAANKNKGALIGQNSAPENRVSVSGFVAWWASGDLKGSGNAISGTSYSIASTSSIYSQAVTLGGWDFTNVWTTDATPQLRPYVAPVE